MLYLLLVYRLLTDTCMMYQNQANHGVHLTNLKNVGIQCKMAIKPLYKQFGSRVCIHNSSLIVIVNTNSEGA